METSEEQPGQNPLGLRSSAGALIVAEALLSTALVVAPLALGTVQLWSLFTMAGLCALSAIAASFARPKRLGFPVWTALGVTVFVGLQAVPLPPELRVFLSPHGAELLVDTLGERGAQAWAPLSLDPGGTAREFVRLLACTGAFFAASRITTDSGATRRLAKTIVIMIAVECVIALIHKATASTQIYGLVTVTQPNFILGSFGNANHFAAYLTLGIPLAISLAVRSSDGAVEPAYAAVAAVASLIVAATVSRSGLGGLFAALLAFGALRSKVTLTTKLRWAVVLGLFAAGLFGLVYVLDTSHREKLAMVLHPSRFLGDIKVRAWLDVPALIRDYWLAGVGRGAFEEIFPFYKHIAERLTFSHVENGPLQALADLGVFVGAGLIVAWFAALVYACRREGMAIRKAAAAALIGITIHELGDFSLEASGAVGLTTAVLWGLCFPANHPLGRFAFFRRIAAALGLAAAGALALGFAWRGDLGRDIAAVKELSAQMQKGDDSDEDRVGALNAQISQAIDRHPVEPWFPLIAGIEKLRQGNAAEAFRFLNRALSLDATAWKPHQAIGEALWQLHHRPQALLEFRLAYSGSGLSDYVANQIISHKGMRFPDLLAGLCGDDPVMIKAFAEQLARVQHLDDAVTALHAFLLLRPTDADAHRLLARIYLAQGRYMQVLDHTSLLSQDDPQATFLSLQALDQLGKTAEAFRMLEDAYENHPTPDLALLLAEHAINDLQPNRALKILEAINQDDLGPESLDRLHGLRGRALEQNGRISQAVSELVMAARINPNQANKMALGALYERCGLWREAILTYRGAIRSTPHPTAAAEAGLRRAEAALGVNAPINAAAPPSADDSDAE